VPETSNDPTLEQLLAYRESEAPEPDRFVVGVMQSVRRERLTRRLILFAFGLVGALFGLLGAALLADSISALFTNAIPSTGIMQAALFAGGAGALYVWFMGDDLPLER
jgi:hypothetical protein